MFELQRRSGGSGRNGACAILKTNALETDMAPEVWS